jgi:hypothetical protein
MPSAARLASNALLRGWGSALTGAVLSIGSGTDHDGEGGRYRDYFPKATSYTTSEVGAEAAGCDLALDIRAMPTVADESYDVVFCSGVLEHVDDVWAARRELWRILRPGGTLLLGVPFRQAIHRAPYDFWRFTEHGLRYLLAAYTLEALVPVDVRDQPSFPATYWVRARKPLPATAQGPDNATPPAAPPASPRPVRRAPTRRAPTRRGPVRPAPADVLPPTTVVCYRWRSADGIARFSVEAVNTLRRMVARHYPRPHRFVCVTDDATGLARGIEIVPLWRDFASLPSPHGPKFPSCYRRLRAFSPEIATLFGPRFVSLDLDCVITGDLQPLWDRAEPLVIWKDTHPRARYNASMLLLSAGARPQVWRRFDPAVSPAETLASGTCNGSDQGWISYCLGPGEATWTSADGVYSFKNEIYKKRPASVLPENARIVLFHGTVKPWSALAQQFRWVRQHYR